MKNTTEAARVIPFKRNKKHKKLAAIIGLGVLVAFVALFTPWFNIKSIQVKGNLLIKQEDIINMSGIPLGQNIFRVNYFRAKSSIKQDLYIEKVSISRNYPNKIIINVEERKRVGYIPFKGNYLVIDKNGIVLEVVNNSNGIDTPVILGLKLKEYKLGKELNPKEQDKVKYDLLMEFFKEISSSSLDGKLSEIDINNPTNIIIWAYKGKYQINMGDEKEFAYKLKFAKTIIEKQEKDKGPSGIINFSNEHRAIFKPR